MLNKKFNNMVNNSEEKFICYNCIGENFLAGIVENDLTNTTCSYCGTEEIEAYSLNDFADLIDIAFEQHFERQSENIPDDWSLEQIKRLASEWEPDGQPVIYAIMDAAVINEQISKDVQMILEAKHYSRSSAEIGETNEYHSESYYDYKSPDDASWQEQWVSFEETLKTKTRFFSKDASEYLKSIFYKLDYLKSDSEKPVVKNIGPNTDILHVFRARAFQTDEKLKLALLSPTEELGPPPYVHAKGGRMNANGIAVFYGATNAKTALAEIRPPVGSKVITAKFEISRSLKILDISALSSIAVNGSIFDKDYASLLTRTTFLRKLSQRMTKAIMPDDEHFEYLPTQAIADFLGSEMGFDGIIFSSAQSLSGLNIALLNHASRVKKNEYPKNSEIEVRLTDWEDDIEVASYQINIEIPKKEIVEDKSKAFGLGIWGISWPTEDPDSRNESLSLDVKSITVDYIKGIEINSINYLVNHSVQEISVNRGMDDISDF